MVFLRWIDKMNKFLLLFIGIALGIMTILIFIQVNVRFVLPLFDIYLSTPWTEELARYLMIWSVFMGAAVATRHAKLIAVDALIFVVQDMVGKIIKVVSHLISLIFFILILILGLYWAMFGLEEKAPVMGILLIYLYSALPIAAGVMILNTIALFIDSYINKKDIRVS